MFEHFKSYKFTYFQDKEFLNRPEVQAVLDQGQQRQDQGQQRSDQGQQRQDQGQPRPDQGRQQHRQDSIKPKPEASRSETQNICKYFLVVFFTNVIIKD